MILVRNLFVVSLTSMMFFTFVEAGCITAPPCLKTRVLQSSPLIPQKKCTACEENPDIVEKQNYALVPIHQEKPGYHQQQISAYHDSDSYYRLKSKQQRSSQLSNHSQEPDCKCKQSSQQSSYSQDNSCKCKQSSQQSSYPRDSTYSPSHQPPSYSKESDCKCKQSSPQSSYSQNGGCKCQQNSQQSNSPLDSSEPSSATGTNHQSHFIVSTHVISQILQPSSYQKTPQSYSTVSQGVKPIQKKPSYQSQSSYPVSSDQQSDAKLNAASPLYHLASNKNEHRPNKPSEGPNYWPVRQPAYAPKPKVSAYSAAPPPKATKKSYAEGTLYEAKKSGERKSTYGKAPTKQSIQISCQKCKKSSYDKPKQGPRIQY